MRIMLASDGSEDGLDALEQLGKVRAGRTDAAVTIVVGWPPRDGPLWRAAYERQVVVEDLHRAIQETVEGVTERLRLIAGTMASEVQSRMEDGDAAEQLAAVVEKEAIDLLIIGVSGGQDHRPHAQAVLDELMARVRKPIVVVFGSAR